MTNRQIVAFVAALCVLAVVLVLGYAPSLDDGQPAPFTPMTVAPAVEYQDETP